MTRFAVAACFVSASLFAASPKHSVTGTQHDLTVTGSSPMTSAVQDACLFCHAPHNVAPNITPLWDHTLSARSYTTYSSTTYNSGTQTPATGSSKLCLSCHDGTVAVGQTTAKGLLPTSGSMRPADVLGTNLATSHPVSMVPLDDGQLATSLFTSPATTKDAAVKLVAGKVECVTCHDPHVQNNDPAVPMFLTRSNSNGAMCLACHEPGRVQPNQLNGWTAGAHATAANTVPATASFGPYATVAANACSNCHGAHNNSSAPRNLRAAEEADCSACHSGGSVSPPLPNIMGEFTKTYAHPTTTVSGAHDAAEAVPVNVTRHAECADCHNSHTAAAQVGIAVAPAIQAAMNGVGGYDTTGVQRPALKEYQVCLKCHGDSSNKPTSSTYGRTAGRYPPGPLPAGLATPPPLPSDPYNIRLKFLSPISHNVMGTSVPTATNTSLRTFMLNVDGTNNTSRPLTTASLIYCTDCHSNDQARASKGTGPNGPHGSSFQHLLQFFLYQEPIGGRSGGNNVASNYALCNKCHNVQGSLRNNSLHSTHMEQGTACTTCHDPHGVIGGNATTSRAMMNFDTTTVRPAGGFLGYYFKSATQGQRGCYLVCHGESHNPRTY